MRNPWRPQTPTSRDAEPGEDEMKEPQRSASIVPRASITKVDDKVRRASAAAAAAATTAIKEDEEEKGKEATSDIQDVKRSTSVASRGSISRTSVTGVDVAARRTSAAAAAVAETTTENEEEEDEEEDDEEDEAEEEEAAGDAKPRDEDDKEPKRSTSIASRTSISRGSVSRFSITGQDDAVRRAAAATEEAGEEEKDEEKEGQGEEEGRGDDDLKELKRSTSVASRGSISRSSITGVDVGLRRTSAASAIGEEKEKAADDANDTERGDDELKELKRSSVASRGSISRTSVTDVDLSVRRTSAAAVTTTEENKGEKRDEDDGEKGKGSN